MPDYSKGKIYTIRCKTDDAKIYVGSTIQNLSARYAGHKGDSKRCKCNWYMEIDDWDNWFIELYENHPCNNKEELNKREGEVIRLIGNLNKNIPGRSNKERYSEYDEKRKNTPERIQQKKEIGHKYREINKEIIKEKKKKYREEHIDEIKERSKKYREEHRAEIKERSKKYREENKEKIKEINRKYREEHKEKISK